MFHVGQKVVCIVNSGWETKYELSDGRIFKVPSNNYPKHKGIYTVSGLDHNNDIYLAEIKNICAFNGDELSWAKIGFRPAIEKNTEAEVSKLKRLLKPLRQEVDA